MYTDKTIHFYFFSFCASVFSLKILQLLILVNEVFQTFSSSHDFFLFNNIFYNIY